MYLLVMPKYWGKQIFTHGSGSKSKDGEKRGGERERLNDDNNNGQATHGALNHAWHTQAAWAKLGSFFEQLTFLYCAHSHPFSQADTWQ